MAAVAWDAEGDGVSFSDPLNWSNDQVPSAVDDVTIDLNGGGTPYQVQISGDHQVQSLNVANADAQLSISSGSLAADVVSIASGSLIFTGGQITADSLINDGTLSAGGTVGLDVDEVLNRGVFSVDTSGTTRLTLDGTLRNFATLELNANGLGNTNLTVVNGKVVNEAGGIMEVGRSATTRFQNIHASIENAGELAFGGRVNFNEDGQSILNTGDLRFDAGNFFSTFDSNITIDQRAGTLTADGRILLDNGTLSVSGGDVQISDLIRLDNGGSIVVSGGTINTDAGVLLLSQRGTFDFTGGDITGETPLSISGNIDVNLTHTGSLNATVNGDVQINGDLFSGQSLVADQGGTDLTFEGGFTNQGEIVFDNPNSIAQSLSTTDGTALVNAENGTLLFTRSGNLQTIGTFINSPITNIGITTVDAFISDSKLNTFTNSGEFRVTENGRYSRSTAGSGTEQSFVQQAGKLVNNGQFDGGGLNVDFLGGVVTGTLVPDNLFVGTNAGGSGVFRPQNSVAGTIQAGQEVIVSGEVDAVGGLVNEGVIRLEPSVSDPATLLVVGDPVRNASEGEIVLTGDAGALSTLRGAVFNSGQLRFDAVDSEVTGLFNQGTTNISTGSVVRIPNNGSVNQQLGQLQIDGSLIADKGGVFNYQGGRIDGETIVLNQGGLGFGSSPVEPHDFLFLGATGEFVSDVPAGATVTLSNRGGEGSSQDLIIPGQWEMNGRLVVGDDLTTGDVKIGSPNDDRIFQVGETGVVEFVGNTGSRTVAQRLVNKGNMIFNTSARVGDGLNSNFGRFHNNGQAVTIVGEGMLNERPGLISGDGSFVFDDGVFGSVETRLINAGEVAPGQSPGTLNMTVDLFEQQSTGVITVELENEDADLIDLSGALKLAGTLNVLTLPGHNAEQNPSQTVIEAEDGIVDAFDSVLFPKALNNAAIKTDQGATTITLNLSTNAADLTTVNVSTADEAVAGDRIPFTYTVRNDGDDTNAGSWVDSIFISSDEQFDPQNAKLLQRILHQGDIASGESYTESTELLVPGVSGPFFIHVLPNSSAEQLETDFSNNSAATLISVDLPEIDTTEDFVLSLQPGQTVFRLIPPNPDGLDIQVFQFDNPEAVGISGTFNRFNFGDDQDFECRPSLEEDDDGLSSCRVDLGTQPTIVRVIYLAGQQSAATVTLPARLESFSLNPIERVFVPLGGAVTTTITGFGFAPDMQGFLVAEDGSESAIDVTVLSSQRAAITYDSTGFSPGPYSLRFLSYDQEQRCEDCTFFDDSSNIDTQDEITVTDTQLRTGRTGRLSVNVKNTGNVDTRSRILLVGGNNVLVGDSPGASQFSASTFIYIANWNGQVDRFGPGESATTSVFATVTSNVQPEVTISEVDPSTQLSLELLVSLLPANISQSEANRGLEALEFGGINTVGGLAEAMRQELVELQEAGQLDPNSPPSASGLVLQVMKFRLDVAAFSIDDDDEVDELIRLSLTTLAPGKVNTLVVDGSGFDPTTGVQFEGDTLRTDIVRFINSTQIQIDIPADQLQRSGAEGRSFVSFDLVLRTTTQNGEVEAVPGLEPIKCRVGVGENEQSRVISRGLGGFGLGANDFYDYGIENYTSGIVVVTVAGGEVTFINRDGIFDTPSSAVELETDQTTGGFIFSGDGGEIRFDADGIMRSITDTDSGLTLLPAYDADGNLIQFLDQLANVVEQIFRDRNGLVTAIENESGKTTFAYDEFLRLTSVTENGVTTSYEYNGAPGVGVAANRLSRVEKEGQRLSFGYLPNGKLSTVTDEDSGEVTKINYTSGGSFLKSGNPLEQNGVPVPGTIEGAQQSKIDQTSQQTNTLTKTSSQLTEARREAAVQEKLREVTNGLGASKPLESVETDSASSVSRSLSLTEKIRLLIKIAKREFNGLTEFAQNDLLPKASRQGLSVVDAFREGGSRIANVFSAAFDAISTRTTVRLGVVGAIDPNDILGPPGFGDRQFVTPDTNFDYTIRFENLAEATAPAQEVFITQQLDDELDLNTFRFSDFGFRDRIIQLDDGGQAFSIVVDDQLETGLNVLVTGQLDVATRTARWTFQSQDPRTGNLPFDALAGFLPPDVVDGQGEGFVSYRTLALPGVKSGDRIDAEASIVFDLNEAIETPPIFNTIDAGAPTASVSQLPEITNTTDFTVEWSGLDDEGGSGIANFDVFVSTGGGEFTPLLLNTTATSTIFSGQDGLRYAFRAVATDNVGFREEDPGIAEATTLVQLNSPPELVKPIADIDVEEDAPARNIDLAEVFNDNDPSSLSFSATSSNDSLVRVEIDGETLTLAFAADVSGIAEVSVTASDGEFETSDTFTVTVSAVNDAPVVVNPIADVTVDEDAEDIVIDLSDIFADVDSDELTLSAVSDDNSLVEASIDGNELRLSFAANANGVATVSVSADDGNLTVSDTFTVTVSAVNDAPVVLNPIADVTVDEDAEDVVIDLSDVFADIDNDELTLAAVSDDDSLVQTSINDNELRLAFAANANGVATVSVLADDGDLTVSDTFTVTVSAVNDAPVVVNPIADVTVDEDAENVVIDLSDVFADIDNDELTLTAVSDDDSLVQTSINDNELRLAFVANANGVTTVRISATDGASSVENSFRVTVDQVNDFGQFDGDLSATIAKGGQAGGTVEFSDTVDGFSTPNFGLFTAAASGTASVQQNGNWTYLPDEGFSGTDSFVIRVTDDDGNVERQRIDITVNSVESSPVRLENGVLVIEGDHSDEDAQDNIRIRKVGPELRVELKSGRDGVVEKFSFAIASVESIRIDAGNGNDTVDMASSIAVPAVVDGGTGNDLIKTGAGNDLITDMSGNNKILSRGGDDRVNTGDGHDWVSSGSGNDLIRTRAGRDVVYAGAGHDIVVAGNDNDVMFGGSGRDILIGGDQSDFGFGGGGQDILIGGWTAYDDNDDALLSILAEWTSERSLRERVRNLWNGSGSEERANGEYFLNRDTVFDDGDFDLLFGGKGIDCYWGC